MVNLLQETKQLCDLYHIKPTRSRGQNFLINEAVYQKVIDTAELKPADTVLEVGPGLGFLTMLLAERAKAVTAVELDQKLAETLKLRLEMKEIKNVGVINANILDWPKINRLPKTLLTEKYKIVANLPYNITSIFLRKFLGGEHQPQTMTLMLQKEVAERLAARPGEMSLLALSVQFYAEAKVVATVDKRDFWPEPAVQSAIVKLVIKKKPPLAALETKDFFRLLKFGFSAKRKMLKNNLGGGLKISASEAESYLTKIGLKPTCRPQDLSLEEWLKLFKEFQEKL